MFNVCPILLFFPCCAHEGGHVPFFAFLDRTIWPALNVKTFNHSDRLESSRSRSAPPETEAPARASFTGRKLAGSTSRTDKATRQAKLGEAARLENGRIICELTLHPGIAVSYPCLGSQDGSSGSAACTGARIAAWLGSLHPMPEASFGWQGPPYPGSAH